MDTSGYSCGGGGGEKWRRREGRARSVILMMMVPFNEPGNWIFVSLELRVDLLLLVVCSSREIAS